MLEDRYYMRETPPFEPRRSATLILLLVNVAVFIVQAVISRFSQFPLNHYFALSLAGLKDGYVWQLLTYMFMHGPLLHLVFNCWAIYVFGTEVEQAVGRKPFLGLYFASGIIGGLFQTVAALMLGREFAAPVVGASAAGFGLAAAFAMLFPERLLLLFFIIPIRAKYLLVICGLLTLYGLMFPTDNIAHAAHLGGMVTGLFVVRYALRWNWHWPRWRKNSRQASPARLVKVYEKSKGWSGGSSSPASEISDEDFVTKEVDPILEKISAFGLQSLTERERKVLEKARAKMARR
jgi:membrane associated rhomboid family serine protease